MLRSYWDKGISFGNTSVSACIVIGISDKKCWLNVRMVRTTCMESPITLSLVVRLRLYGTDLPLKQQSILLFNLGITFERNRRLLNIGNERSNAIKVEHSRLKDSDNREPYHRCTVHKPRHRLSCQNRHRSVTVADVNNENKPCKSPLPLLLPLLSLFLLHHQPLPLHPPTHALPRD